MGKDGPFRDAQVRGAETASQMFPPGTPHPFPISRVAIGLGSCGGRELRRAAGLEEVRTLLTPGCLCEPENLTKPPYPSFSNPPPPGCRSLEGNTWRTGLPVFFF